MTTNAADYHHYAVRAHLNLRAIEARKPADLMFIIMNETMQLSPYRQAAFFDLSLNHQPKLTAASGLVNVDENSPYTVWLNGFAKTFTQLTSPTKISYEDAPASQQEYWQEWLPEHLLVIPLLDKNQQAQAYALYAREPAWTDFEVEQFSTLHATYSYCLSALKRAKPALLGGLKKILSRKGLIIICAGLMALMLLPVRLSALAPAEVIALNAFNVASPQEGVIQSFMVKPNAMVKTGDVLFTLDNTSVGNRYEVAEKALAIAKADALVAQQKAFDDVRSKADLASVMGRVREKEAELAAAEALRSRVEIRAERDGIAVFSDENDWIGRPVQTGERVIQLANPNEAGLLVWLPVHDALNLEAGAPMKLFLHTDPLHPLTAKLKQTSYQSTLSPDNVASYRLKGAFDASEKLPRIGLRGTARLSGEWSILGYYLFRRPIATVREWMGF